MSSKLELFNRISDFIYANDLEDINVFSKQYLHSIVMPIYSDNSNCDDYSIIYMDFNKLNEINLCYGFESGNKIIHDSLELIQSILPENTSILRAGGDEFLFVLPNCQKKDIDNYINRIHLILDNNKNQLSNVSGSFYGIHSSDMSSLGEMIQEADISITNMKNNSKKDGFTNWHTLENKTRHNFESFFNSLRLYNFDIEPSFLKKIYMHTINSTHSLLETDTEDIDTSSETLDSKYILPISDLKKLNSLFQNKNISYTDIDQISEDTYLKLLDNLIREPNTGNFSRNYFQKYLLNNRSKEYKVKYFSTAFVKLFNTLYSHSQTDLGIKRLANNTLSYITNDLDIPIEQKSFLSGDENYFIDLGAGDFALALNPSINTSSLDIDSHISSQNSEFFDFDDLLKFTCSDDFELVNSRNFKDVLTLLCNECKQRKNTYKKDIINDNIISSALNVILADSMEYYMLNIPNNKSIGQKNKYMKIMSKIILDIACSLSKKRDLEENER